MENLKDLDNLMQRARQIDAGKNRELKQQAQRVRDDCAEARKRLNEAKAKILELAPDAARVKTYVQQFRWDLVRANGQPEDVRTHFAELTRCMTAGLNSIREEIRKIDEFSEADLADKWRPATNIGGIVATAGHAKQMVGALERALLYWGEKLNQRLPPIAGGYEAIERSAPAEHEERRIISNLVH
jgi:hypothetical protein